MSGGGGKTKDQTVTQNTAPWGPTQPGLKQAIGDATSLYNQGGFQTPYYPGNTVAGTSPETAAGWDATTQRAMAGSPNLKAAQGANLALLSGDYSALNPLFHTVQDSVNSNYSLGGRYGSSAHDRGVSEGIGNVIAGNLNNAIGQAPGLAQADYLDPQMLGQVGQQREAAGQQNINADILRYNANQQAPIDAIQQYMGLLSGNWGGSTTTTQPVQQQSSNPWLGLLGAGLGVAGGFF